VELFERVLPSSSWPSLKTPPMERPFRAGVVDVRERNTDVELTKSPPSYAKWVRAVCRVGVQRWNSSGKEADSNPVCTVGIQ